MAKILPQSFSCGALWFRIEEQCSIFVQENTKSRFRGSVTDLGCGVSVPGFTTSFRGAIGISGTSEPVTHSDQRSLIAHWPVQELAQVDSLEFDPPVPEGWLWAVQGLRFPGVLGVAGDCQVGCGAAAQSAMVRAEYGYRAIRTNRRPAHRKRQLAEHRQPVPAAPSTRLPPIARLASLRYLRSFS